MNALYDLVVAVASLPVAVLMARLALMPLIAALAANQGSTRE
jgi:hypothetical protein